MNTEQITPRDQSRHMLEESNRHVIELTSGSAGESSCLVCTPTQQPVAGELADYREAPTAVF